MACTHADYAALRAAKHMREAGTSSRPRGAVSGRMHALSVIMKCGRCGSKIKDKQFIVRVNLLPTQKIEFVGIVGVYRRKGRSWRFDTTRADRVGQRTSTTVNRGMCQACVNEVREGQSVSAIRSPWTSTGLTP